MIWFNIDLFDLFMIFTNDLLMILFDLIWFNIDLFFTDNFCYNLKIFKSTNFLIYSKYQKKMDKSDKSKAKIRNKNHKKKVLPNVLINRVKFIKKGLKNQVIIMSQQPKILKMSQQFKTKM